MKPLFPFIAPYSPRGRFGLTVALHNGTVHTAYALLSWLVRVCIVLLSQGNAGKNFLISFNEVKR
jgi:hypothetical protein